MPDQNPKDWKWYLYRITAVTVPAIAAAVGSYYKSHTESTDRTEVEYQTLKGAVDNINQALANMTASAQAHATIDEQREALVQDQIRTLSRKTWAGHHQPETMDIENAYLGTVGGGSTPVASKPDGGVLTLNEIVVSGKTVPPPTPKFKPVKLPATLDMAVEATTK